MQTAPPRPIRAALILGSGVVMARQVATGWLADLIFVAAAAWVLATRRNPVWPLLAGAGLGVALAALG